jgi:chromate transport protein ChrA
MAVLLVVAFTLLVVETTTIWWVFQSGLVGFLLIAGTIDTIKHRKRKQR